MHTHIQYICQAWRRETNTNQSSSYKKFQCAFTVNVQESIPLSKQKMVDYMGGINHNPKYVPFIVRDI